MKREVEFVYDFKAFGQAIKKARRAAGYSRKKLGHELNLAPRYLVSIENEGQHPSLQVLYELCTFFDISVNQFFFPDKVASKHEGVRVVSIRCVHAGSVSETVQRRGPGGNSGCVCTKSGDRETG